MRWVLLGALLLCLGFGVYKARRAWTSIQALQLHMDGLQTLAGGSDDMDFREAGDSLQGLHDALVALEGEVGFLMPGFRLLGWLPGIGPDLHAAPSLFDMALAVSKAGSVALDGLEPMLAMLEGNAANGSPLPRALAILSDAQPQLQTAQTHIAEAARHRAEIDSSLLSPRLTGWMTRFDRYLPLMQTAFDGVGLLPSLLGAEGERTYLVLVQNNDELRATGGFISAIGLLRLDHGEIVEISFEDSYAVDDFTHPYPDSPAPILRYMGIDQWVFRDANWSPDFPTAAQKALELYRISRELEVDGVLAVDQYALQTIVDALAPIEVEAWSEPVTGRNVISLIRLAWSPDGQNTAGFDAAWWRQRKSFMSDIFHALQHKIESTPGQINWTALARALLDTLDERHMQVWLAAPGNQAADLLAQRGWDGAIRQHNSDYVMVVDTNMGYNKANAAVDERLDYRVLVRADGSAQATLTIHYTNGSKHDKVCDPSPRYGADYADLIDRCYWDYVRVYAPAGAQLLGATAHPVSAEMVITKQAQAGAWELLPEEKGKSVFGVFFVLPSGQELQQRFVYELPPATLTQMDGGWHYRLLVQKQAGTEALPLCITLNLPPGARVETVTTPEDGGHVAFQQPEPGVVTFATTLLKDRFFDVLYHVAPSGG
jgi:hypothetical protein